MHLSLSSVVLALGLVSTAAADRLVVTRTCYGGALCRNFGAFVTDFGVYSVNADDGCHGTSVPGMVEFCVDWSRVRGHFRFSHQSHKRCMGVSQPDMDTCAKLISCDTWTFEEVPCTWRLPADDEYPNPGDEAIATLSATLAAADATVAATLPGSSEPAVPVEKL
ncbi:uncharacterized protein CTRU02_210186 [Colletotrichum truncatum]|uniref:Uncharacterized protein n=1 Tax=Colletotrichum truncatum TaxID=5467 RepID=A0ACC3YUL1_COLTU|nr:uncharacterized protein CTRU02_15703 [Colletotrichum truncatum]KAF6780743.1 hypothetical protein CTRU02_15703 [Colletotrichum truncatum]